MLALLVLATITILILLPRSDTAVFLDTSGDAEAVSTTKITIYDGIWDSRRYSDELYYPIGIALLNDGLIVADSMCDRVQIIDGESNRRIGRPGQYGLSYLESGALIDGYREAALFMKPAGVFVCDDGEVLIADTGNHVIRRMDEEYVITIAGNGESGYRNGKEHDARFNSPRSAVMGADGFVYVADTLNHCIRRIDTDGNVTLFAGVPEQSGYADGALAEAMFYEPCGLAVGEDGALYVADSANHTIRKIADGMVTTVAGLPGAVSRSTGYPEGGYIDGELSAARFNYPRDVAVLPDHGLVVADSMNHAIRLVGTETVRTLAGNGMAGQFYASVENLKLSRPEGICTDGKMLYISDTLNNRVLSIPLTERVLEGRPSRGKLLADTGVSINSRYAYNGDIRVYIDNQRVDMGRVQPWNTAERIYVPIRPLFEALGAVVTVDERTDTLAVTIQGQDTVLRLDKDYFILRGIAVTTIEEIERLFPYVFEWFPDLSLIALHVPYDILSVD
ncbi:MAG: stalk domain-containing protein [Defluviitaleaceae bacterium]|nr:stalk domain-containing protein [Defluviitaleaceae bacterium]